MPEDVDGKQNQKVNAQIQAYLNAYTVLTGMAPGDVFFVSSVTGSASNPGNSVNKPRATIESCFTPATVLVEANKGDIIFALPGHTEAVVAAGGLDLDIAGVTIYFLGDGAAQAKVTFGTLVGADMDIDAASITLVRPKFVAALDALTGPIDVNAADCTIIDALFEDTTNIDTTDALVAVPAAIRLKILGWRYIRGNEGGTQKQSHIQLNGVDDAILKDIDIRGDFAVGPIENVTDEALNIRLKNIYLDNLNAGPQPGMVLDSACTGLADNVKIRVASGTTYVSDNSDINWSNSHGTQTDGSALDDPIGVATATGPEGKLDTIDTNVDTLLSQLAGPAGVATFPAAAAADDGISVAEVLRYLSELQTPRIVLKSSGDLTSFGTSKNLFTVTGDVLCKVGASVDVAVTSTSGTTTLEAGIAGNTAASLIQDAVDNTAFDVGDSWTLITPPDTNGGQMADEYLLIGNSATIVLTGSVDDITAGEIDFYCQFIPLYAGAGVVAAV